MATIRVSLDIRNNQYSPGQGWATVTAANGDQYSFKYSGGSNGNGGVSVTEPNTVIQVDLICDARYHISSVTLTDPKGDVSETHTTRQATLTDTDADKDYDIYYGLNIQDTVANTSFSCDPEIHNEEEE